MTIIISVCSKDGIVMGADRKISIQKENKFETVDERDKIIIFEKERIAISYWGLATINGKRTSEIINDVYESLDSISVDSISNVLKEWLQKNKISSSLGFHVCGYLENLPKIRHVFHNKLYHYDGEACNEETNVEFHDTFGRRISHTRLEDYIKYIILFNGDNSTVRSFLNSLPISVGEYTSSSGYRIDYENMNLNELVSFVKLLLGISIYMQNFLVGYRRIGNTQGNGIDIVTITPSKIERVLENSKEISLNLI